MAKGSAGEVKELTTAEQDRARRLDTLKEAIERCEARQADLLDQKKKLAERIISRPLSIVRGVFLGVQGELEENEFFLDALQSEVERLKAE